jgi:hypothetical protein
MAAMRMKVYVTEVKPLGEPKCAELLSFSVVCPSKFEADGSSEDNSFARWSPSGGVSVTCNNPALFDKFVAGQKFYVDFTEAPDSPTAQADGANG